MATRFITEVSSSLEYASRKSSEDVVKEFINTRVGLELSIGPEVWYAAVIPPRCETSTVFVFGILSVSSCSYGWGDVAMRRKY